MKRKCVLFLCTGNSCRSQMAEGFARKYFLLNWRVESAGIEAHGVNPIAIVVMNEVGIDISNQRSKCIDEIGNLEPDVVITLCGDANEKCPLYPADVIKEHWAIPDPAKATGNTEDILIVFRRIRDDIEQMVGEVAKQLKSISFYFFY